MDRKIKVFISCLLIVIPVTTGVASLFVNHPAHTQNLIKPIPELGVYIPTVVMHPTPTLFISQKTLEAKKFQASTAAQLRALNLQASAKGIIIDNPNTTGIMNPTVTVSPTKSTTPAIITPSAAPVITAPPIIPVAASFDGSAQSFGSTRSAVIIDKPSSMVISNESLNNASSDTLLQN